MSEWTSGDPDLTEGMDGAGFFSTYFNVGSDDLQRDAYAQDAGLQPDLENERLAHQLLESAGNNFDALDPADQLRLLRYRGGLSLDEYMLALRLIDGFVQGKPVDIKINMKLGINPEYLQPCPSCEVRRDYLMVYGSGGRVVFDPAPLRPVIEGSEHCGEHTRESLRQYAAPHYLRALIEKREVEGSLSEAEYREASTILGIVSPSEEQCVDCTAGRLPENIGVAVEGSDSCRDHTRYRLQYEAGSRTHLPELRIPTQYVGFTPDLPSQN